MQVDGDVKRLGCFKQRSEFRIIEKLAVDRAIHHDAFEPKLSNAAFEFLGGFLRILQGKRAERGKAVRVGSHGRGHRVVGVAGHGVPGGGFHLVDQAGGDREHLHADAGGIHVGEAAFADVEQLGLKRLDECICGKPAAFAVRGGVHDARGCHVLFESDDSH